MRVQKQDVVLSIQGCRFSPKPEDNLFMNLQTDGLMVSHRNGYTVSYREPFDGGAETTLLVEGDRVTMLRGGEQGAQMVFEEGRRHVSYVDTAEGSMTVGVTASRVEAELDETGGHIEMTYGVEIAGSISEESHVSIDIHAASGSWASAPDGITVYRDNFIN